MKRTTPLTLFILIAILNFIQPTHIFAIPGQWSATGNIIYYNEGNIGIGTNSPLLPLQVTNTTTGLSQILVGSGRGSFDISANAFSDGNGYNNIGSNAYWNGTTWQRRENNKESWVQGNFISGNNTGNFAISHADAGTGTITNFKQFFSINSIGDPTFTRATGSSLVVQTPSSDIRLYTAGKPLILASGNVGIGTINPQRLLSVNGTILAKEIIVSNAASYWPDYVFNKDYKMMDLAEVENYIKINKHLPNIPSQEEIKTSGISLGEMLKLQMEKIEELTLYTIQQEKNISELKNENQDLNMRLEKLEKIVNK